MKTLLKVLIVVMFLALPTYSHAAFKLLFSDLPSGPRDCRLDGWPGSTATGAAVTIWGLELGTGPDGSNYVTVAGQNLTTANSYANWGVTTNNANISPNVPLESITFYLDSSMSTGATTISVTVAGVTSETIPFFVRSSGNCYFINNNGGSNGYNGRYETFQSGSNGPFATVNQALNSQSGIAKDSIVYLKAGTGAYTNGSGFIMQFRDDASTVNAEGALIGYPGEWPVIGDGSNGSNIGTCEGCGPMGHYVLSRFIIKAGAGAIHATGYNYRFTGVRFEDGQINCLCGTVGASPQWESKYYGNVWKDSGGNAYKHAIYFNSEDADGTWKAHATENNEVAYNEFDNYDNYTGEYFGGGIVEIKRQTSDPFPTNNIQVHHNYFHDNEGMNPVWITRASNVDVYNNIFSNVCHLGDGTSRGCILLNGDSNSIGNKVRNNTFYNFGHPTNNGDIAAIRLRGNETVSVTNNIFRGTLSPAPPTITNEGNAICTGTKNVIFGATVPASGSSGCTLTNTSTSNPSFISAPTNLRLNVGSPILDTGDNASCPQRDSDQNLRPYNGTCDPGAFEYVTGGAPTTTTTTTTTLGTTTTTTIAPTTTTTIAPTTSTTTTTTGTTTTTIATSLPNRMGDNKRGFVDWPIQSGENTFPVEIKDFFGNPYPGLNIANVTEGVVFLFNASGPPVSVGVIDLVDFVGGQYRVRTNTDLTWITPGSMGMALVKLDTPGAVVTPFMFRAVLNTPQDEREMYERSLGP